MEPEKPDFRLEIRPTIQTRSPRELLIFSLDDTLIDTSLYWLARANLARAAALKAGKMEAQNAGVRQSLDPENGRVFEASPEYDPAMTHAAWEAFRKQCDIPEGGDADLELLVAQCLRSKFPLPIPGAEDLLKWAFDRFTVVLLTSGDRELQLRKLEASNLKRFFKDVKVVASKGIEELRAVMSEKGFSPRNSWIIGDSIRHDINPAIAARANCIRYVNPYAKLMGIQDDIEEPVGRAFRIHALADARSILAKPTSSIAA
jgi:putative hydrolase of the HAD superfamily